jgi:hypothetical protein
MAEDGRTGLRGLDWLTELGLSVEETQRLNPCVPGEFTMPDTFYVNVATPRVIYRAGNEGTLPLVPGRWFLVPENVARRYPNLARETVPVARAVRLTR